MKLSSTRSVAIIIFIILGSSLAGYKYIPDLDGYSLSKSVSYAEFVNALAAAGAFIIAYSALSTWKQQHKNQIITAFLNEVMSTYHQYIFELRKLNSCYNMLRYEIDLFRTHHDFDAHTPHHEAILFLNEARKSDQLNTDRINEHYVNLASLSVRGQMYNLKNYKSIYDLCSSLLAQRDRILTLLQFFQRDSQHLNFDHPVVSKNLDTFMGITSDSILTDMTNIELKLNELMNEAFKSSFYDSEQ